MREETCLKFSQVGENALGTIQLVEQYQKRMVDGKALS